VACHRRAVPPLGARASRPHPGSAVAGGWRMPSPPSPCGLRARGRAHLQPWHWHGSPSPCGLRARGRAHLQPWHWHGSPSPCGLRARDRAHLQTWHWHSSPSPCGLRARGRAHLQIWHWHGSQPLPLQHVPGDAAGLRRRGAPAPIFPWERGRLARIREMYWFGGCRMPNSRTGRATARWSPTRAR
jgi:hypothetical protein